jgi:thiamine pyrophosphate-dependent acetolactate synthase large subunit-like protein
MTTASQWIGDGAIHRRPLMAQMLNGAGDDLLLVTGLGQTCYDSAAAGDRDLTFPLWGAMGAAVMIGLGIALAQPAKRVLVATGDGEMLMGLGAFASIAAQAPRNLAIAVFDNEHFGETGNQATHTAAPGQGPVKSGAGTDLAAVARGCGIADVGTVRTAGEVPAAVEACRNAPGPLVRVFKVLNEKLPLVMPPRDGAYLKDRFRAALLGAP